MCYFKKKLLVSAISNTKQFFLERYLEGFKTLKAKG